MFVFQTVQFRDANSSGSKKLTGVKISKTADPHAGYMKEFKKSAQVLKLNPDGSYVLGKSVGTLNMGQMKKDGWSIYSFWISVPPNDNLNQVGFEIRSPSASKPEDILSVRLKSNGVIMGNKFKPVSFSPGDTVMMQIMICSDKTYTLRMFNKNKEEILPLTEVNTSKNAGWARLFDGLGAYKLYQTVTVTAKPSVAPPVQKTPQIAGAVDLDQNGNFKFSPPPSSNKNRFEREYAYLKSRAGAEKYADFVLLRIDGFYLEYGVSRLQLPQGARETIIKRMMEMREFKGKRSKNFGELRGNTIVGSGTKTLVEIDTLASGYSKEELTELMVRITRHELFHVASNGWIPPVAEQKALEEGMTSLLAQNGYPHTVAAIKEYLTSLKRTNPARCKQAMDALVLDWLNLATPQQRELAEQTVGVAALRGYALDEGWEFFMER